MNTVISNGIAITRLRPQKDPGGGIPEAPMDGKTYGRKDGDWAETTDKRNAYFSLEKVQPNLYDVRYDSLDYDAALAYFAGTAPALNLGGCSTIIKNGFAGRNYDWHNNKGASFEVHTPNAQGHFKVFGIAGGLADLTVAKVESREYSDLYKILPFYLTDGMNEKKLFAEVNVVPTTGNTRTVPLVEKRESICSLMLVRYILDNFESVSDAVDYINDYVEVYFPQGLLDMGYETHWMLRDATSCVVIEIADNTIVAVASNKSTNFHVTGVTFNEDGSVYTNADVPDGNLPTSQGIDAFGMGLERWNLLNAGTPTDKATMAALMRSLFFSKTYTELTDVWYSEFTGDTITVDTLPTDTKMQEVIALARQAYADDSEEVDITVHSVVYDLDKCEAYVVVQERDAEHKFALDDVVPETDAVKYTPQTLTEAQKAQARANIGVKEGSVADNTFYIQWNINDTQKNLIYGGDLGAISAFRNWVLKGARPCEIKKDGTDFAYLRNDEGVASNVNWLKREDGTDSHYASSDKLDYIQEVEIRSINLGYYRDETAGIARVLFNMDETCPSGFYPLFKDGFKDMPRYDMTFNADGVSADVAAGTSRPTGNWSADVIFSHAKAINASQVRFVTAWEIQAFAWIQAAFYGTFNMQATELGTGISTGDESSRRSYVNGSTDSLTAPNGKIASNAFRFMYMENAFYGKEWLWGAGFYTTTKNAYRMTLDEDKAANAAVISAANAEITASFVNTSETTPGFMYGKNVDFFAGMIKAEGGSTSSGFFDGVYCGTQFERILFTGGSNNGENCGPFARHIANLSTLVYWDQRGRCCIKRTV